ncbi:MAG: hypothetical protein Q8Q02_09825 [Nocardioides sp.]|nr:hypothetical protein [Nocardioides sp.]
MEPLGMRGRARRAEWVAVSHGLHRRSEHGPVRRGLRFSRHPTAPERELHRGLWVSSPGETLLACARDLGGLDLVLVVDGALAAGVPQPDLVAAASQRRRGAPALRRALAMADRRSESPWETLLRVLHDCLEVEVEPQHVVSDSDGRFVARADLWLVGTRTIHEYDGGVHLTQTRQHDDLRRTRDLQHCGWIRNGYTATDVVRSPVVIARDVDRALGRPGDVRRLTRWSALLRESGCTPAGRSRLAARWSD